MKKRFMSMLLVLCMLFALLPATVSAASNPEIYDFNGLKQAVESYDGGTQHVYYYGEGHLMIQEDIAIPEGMWLHTNEKAVFVMPAVELKLAGHLNADLLSVEKGGLFTVEGDGYANLENGLSVRGVVKNNGGWLSIHGGSISVDGSIENDGCLRINDYRVGLIGEANIHNTENGWIEWHLNINRQADFATVMNAVNNDLRNYNDVELYVQCDVVMDGSYNLRSGATLTVTDNGSLTIGEGYSFATNDTIFVRGGIEVAGHWDCQGRLAIFRQGNANGEVRLNGGSFICTDRIQIYVDSQDDTAANAMPGFDMSCFDVQWDAGSTRWKLTQTRAAVGGSGDGSGDDDLGDGRVTFSSYDELKAKLSKYTGGELHMEYVGELTGFPISGELVIPENVFVDLISAGASAVVLDGGNLTVKGHLMSNHMTIEAGGTVTVPEYGSVSVNGQFWVGGTLIAQEYGYVYSWGDLQVAGKFRLDGMLGLDYDNSTVQSWANIEKGRRGGILWVFDAYDTDSFCRALDIADRELGEDYVEINMYEGSAVLVEDVTLPEYVDVYIGPEATLTIDSGAELTVEGMLYVEGVVEIKGTLNNDGFVDLWRRGDVEATLVLAPGGTYAGKGYLTVYDDNLDDDPDQALVGFSMDDFTVEQQTGTDDNWYFWDYWLKGESTGGAGGVKPGELAPGGLRIAADNTGLTVTWEPEDDVARYAVYRSIDGGEFKWVAGVNDCQYKDTAVKSGKTYSYKVACYLQESGIGEISQPVKVSYRIAGPDGLSVKYINKKVELSWNVQEGTSRYAVYRSANGGEFKWLGSVDTNSYTDTSVVEGGSYSYKVACYNPGGSGVGDWSGAASVVCEIPEMPVPAKPNKIVNVVSGVHVYWKDTKGADKYGLWRSETGKNGTYKWIANPTVAHFTDTKVESGKTYFYKVTSMDVETNTHSEKSEAIGIVYTATPDITTRKNVAAGVELGWNQIKGATGYAIYRKSYSGTDAWARVGTIPGNETFTWIDESVKNNNGSEYRYTIRALGGADMKTLSGCRNAGRTMVRLSSQVLKSADMVNRISVKCGWTTSKMVTGYEVRFMIGDEVFKTFTVGNYKTGVKTFTGLKADETYTVQVRTYKKVDGVGSFYSDWSEAKQVKLVSHYSIEMEEGMEIVLENRTFNGNVTIYGDNAKVLFINCTIDGDLILKSEEGTKVFLIGGSKVKGECIIRNSIKEADLLESSFPKFLTDAPLAVTCKDCYGAVIGLGDVELMLNGESYSLKDGDVFFDGTQLAPYKDQQANIFCVAQYWENGKMTVTVLCEYDPTL